jgi:hypothetical protein
VCCRHGMSHLRRPADGDADVRIVLLQLSGLKSYEVLAIIAL